MYYHTFDPNRFCPCDVCNRFSCENARMTYVTNFSDLKNLSSTKTEMAEQYDLFETEEVLKPEFRQQLINNKNTMNNFFKKLTDKKIQALVKAGYLSSDLKITLKGNGALIELIFLANYDELVKLANEEIEETEKKK